MDPHKDTTATVPAGADRTRRSAAVGARIDRLPRVGLPTVASAVLLFTFFFANYDIGVVSITLPSLSADLDLKVTDLSWPVTLNLIGYAVGAYALGHIADRRGRLVGLRGTIVVLGIGGLLTALSWDVWSFAVFRFICGCGMGAVLALASAYIGEIAPRDKRGRYLTLIYLAQALLISVVGFGSLPVLDLGPVGWRILIGFGALVLLVLPGFTDRCVPESPRWLAGHGDLDRAERITAEMERRAYRDGAVPVLRTADVVAEAPIDDHHSPLRSLLRGPLLRRVLLISSFWFFFYIGFYAFSSYQPLLLEGLGVERSQALWLTVVGRVSGVLSCLILLGLIERFERRTIIVISSLAIIASFGLLIIGEGGFIFVVANLLFTFALGILVPPAFTYTAEIFPTRSRGTAAAIGDGVGHLGGAVAPFIVLPVLAAFGAEWAMLVLSASILIATVSVAFGPRTRQRALTEIAH
ncbi:MFS transporter [Nakamurella sp. GG22]